MPRISSASDIHLFLFDRRSCFSCYFFNIIMCVSTRMINLYDKIVIFIIIDFDIVRKFNSDIIFCVKRLG